MGHSRISTEAPSSFSNGSCAGKSSREVGASLGGPDHLRGCTERLFGFPQEVLEFHKGTRRDAEPCRGNVIRERGAGLQALPEVQRRNPSSCHFLFWAAFPKELIS